AFSTCYEHKPKKYKTLVCLNPFQTPLPPAESRGRPHPNRSQKSGAVTQMRASRRALSTFLALIVLVLGASLTASAQAPQTFQHPGVLVSQAHLDYIKTMVAAHNEPFYSAFIKAQNSNIGSLTYQIQGPPATGIIECGPTS